MEGNGKGGAAIRLGYVTRRTAPQLKGRFRTWSKSIWSIWRSRDKVAKGVRILVREGLIPNAGHISVRPSGADWFWTLRHVHVGARLCWAGGRHPLRHEG